MLHQIRLSGKTIDYQLKRSQRKTIGLKINHQGLQVNAPPGLPTTQIDTLLQTKANWILKHLESRKKQPAPSDEWLLDSQYPLLGNLWKPSIQSCGKIQMLRVTDDGKTTPPDEINHLTGLSPSPELAQTWMMSWYQQHATTCFDQRIALFAKKLNVPRPPFKLSKARTRWGSCNSRGVIRLNWRLIQLPLHLIDYVVAHELAHLIEMNHSPAFWKLVGSIYPDYQHARKELKQYTLG